MRARGYNGIKSLMGNTLIERIDAELARTGLNDESASKKAGLHRDTIRDLRRGKRRMLNAENLAALAEVLGTTTAHLLGHWEDDPDSNDSPAAFSRYLSKRYGGSEGAYFRESYAPKIQGAIPELDVRLGAGEGSVGEVLVLPINGDTYSGHRIVDEWLLPEPFLRSEAHASVSSTIVMPVTGDSMLPNYNYGDRVLVDLAQNTFVQDAVYAISDGQTEPRIKRLQYVFNSSPRRVKIISDNPVYQPEEHLLSDVRIIGRVCGVIARR